MANVLPTGQILEALRNTLNCQDGVRKPAEALLRSNETTTGFASTLLECLVHPDADAQSRLLAAIYLKNNIQRYWRGVIAVRISDSEKDHMRPRILALLPELDQQCLIHMVPAITKIFISDDPDKNAETLQVLLKPLIGASQLNCEIFRALMVFKSLVKQWRALFGFQFKAHEKIALFKQSADDIVGLVLPLWRQSVQSVLQMAAHHPREILDHLKTCTACIRDLLSGHAQLECTDQVISEVFESLKALSQLCLNADASSLSPEMISVTQSQGKLIHRVLVKYPRIFVGADGSKISGLLTYVLDRLIEGLQLSPDKHRSAFSILVPCANILSRLLLCGEYRQKTGARVGPYEARRREERRSDEQKAFATGVEQVIGSVMTPDRVSQLCSALISSGLQLSPQDLEDWRNEPENFAIGCTQPAAHSSDTECKEAWKRSQALQEAICAVIRSETKTALPVVLDLYSNAGSILLKDACLHAIGLSLDGKGLGEDLDLSQWISETLGPEFAKSDPDQVVLHRRIIWLLGRATEYISSELREQFCGLMISQVSQPGVDPVIRLTAAASLATLMEAIADAPITKDIETEQDPVPLVKTLLELFTNVESEALRSDLLKAVCGMMRMYRSRSRHRKRKQLPGWDQPWAAGQITLQAVMPLMQVVSESDVLKSIVIDVMAELILCGIGGTDAIGLAVQLIDPCMSLEFDADEGLFLRESAQRLWRNVLNVAPPLELVTLLFPRAVILLDHEHGARLGEREVPLLLHIIADYFVIGDVQFCVRHAPEALQSVVSYLSSEEHSAQLRVSLTRLINVLASILGSTEELVNIMGPVYTRVFFRPQVGGVAALWDNSASRFEIAYSLARISMQSPHNLIKVLQSVLLACGANDVNSFRKIIYHWLEAVSKVSAPGVRLIVLCGISSVFTLDEGVLHELFAEMVGVVTKLLHTALKPMELQRRGWLEVHPERRYETERKLLLCGVDGNAEQVPGLVMARLRQCADHVGHSVFQQLVQKLPPELQQQLQVLSAQFTPPQSPVLGSQTQVNTPQLINSPAMPPSPLPRATSVLPGNVTLQPVSGSNIPQLSMPPTHFEL